MHMHMSTLGKADVIGENECNTTYGAHSLFDDFDSNFWVLREEHKHLVCTANRSYVYSVGILAPNKHSLVPRHLGTRLTTHTAITCRVIVVGNQHREVGS